MSNINMTIRHEYNDTPIPNAFIDNYMMKANPVYALIYIYGIRLCAGGGGGLSTSELAENLNILESDVENAWKYWEKQGLVQIGKLNEQLDVVFLSIPVEQKKNQRSKGLKVSNPVIRATKPQYAVKELEIYQEQSRDIKDLFKYAERMMGKLLTYNDLNVIFGFYDWLRLPIEVIEFLFEYCVDHDHRDLRYIEKVAVDWVENGVTTLTNAREYVKAMNHDYKDIMSALGGSGQPSVSQKRYIDKWLYTYRMPIEVIVEACDITAIQLGRPKITYVDKILEDWDKKNIHSIESIKREKTAFAETRVKKPSFKVEKKNRFVNFNPRQRDYEELERLEQEQLLKNMH
ncbi:MAG: DnaD domain protein [Clostridiales bacterium]|jgi:DnaD/phage-associated family protein|nr:DnaD domain protein [Clostridiales bacterium]